MELLNVKLVYLMNHVYLGKFKKKKKVLETSDVTKVKVLDEEINIEVNTIESLVKNLVCGFVAVSINTILPKFCATDTTKNKSI